MHIKSTMINSYNKTIVQCIISSYKNQILAIDWALKGKEGKPDNGLIFQNELHHSMSSCISCGIQLLYIAYQSQFLSQLPLSAWYHQFPDLSLPCAAPAKLILNWTFSFFISRVEVELNRKEFKILHVEKEVRTWKEINTFAKYIAGFSEHCKIANRACLKCPDVSPFTAW